MRRSADGIGSATPSEPERSRPLAPPASSLGPAMFVAAGTAARCSAPMGRSAAALVDHDDLAVDHHHLAAEGRVQMLSPEDLRGCARTHQAAGRGSPPVETPGRKIEVMSRHQHCHRMS